jgi:septum formation protein
VSEPTGEPSAPTFVLASASPARLATLRAAGLDPVCLVSGVDEDGVAAPDAATLVATLARLKAEAVFAVADLPERVVVVGCDSVLDLAGEVHGKPADVDQARARWRALRGNSGVLRTGHHVIARLDGRVTTAAAVADTVVHFADLDDAEIEAYLGSGEPLAVAGAFTIDGLGGAFVERIEGDPHNVVGISLPLLRRLLAGLGVPWPSLWRGSAGDGTAR